MSRCACGRPKPDNTEACIRCRAAARVYPPAPDQTTCTVCGLVAKTRAGLVSHVRAAHSEDDAD